MTSSAREKKTSKSVIEIAKYACGLPVTHRRHLPPVTHPGHLSPRLGQPRGRVASWTMGEITFGDHEGQASPSEGASTHGTPEPAPEPAPEPEVIEVALGTDLDILPHV